MLALALLAGAALSTSGAFAGAPANPPVGKAGLAADPQSGTKIDLSREKSDVVPEIMRAISGKPMAPDAVGDVRYSFNVETVTNPPLNVSLGTEYVNGFYWVTGRDLGTNVKKLVKLNADGQFVTEFVQQACASTTFGYRDLAFNGTNLVTVTSAVLT